mgnify:CR=1 FL=1
MQFNITQTEVKILSIDELHIRTLDVARREQRTTTELLQHLIAVRDRRVFAVKGYGGLWEYVRHYLGYSEPATNERLRAMELIEAVPEVEKQIQRGELSLTTASQVQVFIRKLERKEKKKLAPAAKQELIDEVAGKSKRQVEQIFASIAPEVQIPKEREKVLTPELTQLSLVVDSETMEMLKRFQELKGNQNHCEILKTTLKEYLKRNDPEKKSSSVEAKLEFVETQSTEENTFLSLTQHQPADVTDRSPSRYVPVDSKRRIWQRAHSQCEYIDPKSKRRCESRHRLQLDHIIPWSVGGKTDFSNLRLACPTHNTLYAIQYFGEKKMNRWLKG